MDRCVPNVVFRGNHFDEAVERVRGIRQFEMLQVSPQARRIPAERSGIDPCLRSIVFTGKAARFHARTCSSQRACVAGTIRSGSISSEPGVTTGSPNRYDRVEPTETTQRGDQIGVGCSCEIFSISVISAVTRSPGAAHLQTINPASFKSETNVLRALASCAVVAVALFGVILVAL